MSAGVWSAKGDTPVLPGLRVAQRHQNEGESLQSVLSGHQGNRAMFPSLGGGVGQKDLGLAGVFSWLEEASGGT